MSPRTTGRWLICLPCDGTGNELDAPWYKRGTCLPCDGQGFIYETWPCCRAPSDKGWAEHEWVFTARLVSSKDFVTSGKPYCAACGMPSSEIVGAQRS